ncbi:MAG: hypothetical protein H6537_10600 [Bacteroidales bacterium]|nr:hypothetical protein [Bacteroidales bacterium]HPD94780.1 hypothetical protein [Tenuifilaceae bacterium]HRX31633.1 hypothetical protein [Tenuifilaceae bacterium]
MPKLLTIILFQSLALSVQASQQYFWKPVYAPFDSVMNVMDQLSNEDPRQQDLLLKLHSIADNKGLPVLESRYLYWKNYLNEKSPTKNNNSIKKELQRAIGLIDTLEYEYDYARIRYLMINPVQNEENYIEQYKTYIKLLSIFEKTGDLKFQANTCRRLGILMSELGENESALEYLLKANNLYEDLNLQDLIVTNMVNIAVVYNNVGKPNEAIKILEGILQKRNVQLDTNVLVTIYTNLNGSSSNIEKKNFYAEKAFQLSKKYNKNKYQLNVTKINMGSSFLSNEQYDSALVYFSQVYTYAIQHKTSRLLIASLENMSQTYEKMQNWNQAYKYLSTYLHVKDSIKGADKISEINRIEANIAIKEYQNQLLIEHQKNELRKKQATIIILSAIGTILIILLILLYVWHKKRLTEGQLQNEELQNKNLQLEIDSQNRELSATTLILSEKNGILNNLLAQMERFRSDKEMSNTCEQTLRKLITDNLRTENEWESFKLHFEKVHPNFFHNLKERFPNLSENELRLCAYIRIGMSSKQISQMISVLPATIKTNRYLLRKKFQLDTKDSLDDFIRSI